MVSRELVLYIKTNQKSGNLVAFCVGKTVGTAVARNYMKRRLREAFRLLETQINPGYTLAWVARAKAKNLSYRELCQRMEELLLKAKLLRTDGE